jgi:hypothetical protein
MNSYASEVEFEQQKIPVNEYMDGTCYRCGEYNAPVSIELLMALPKSNRVHIGSTKIQKDEDTLYDRRIWYEIFRCPHCKHTYAVPFSSV